MSGNGSVVISTIGDSLTQGNIIHYGFGGPGNTFFQQPETIQCHLKNWLEENGVPGAVVWNWGIGGQIMTEIASRFRVTTEGPILTAGTPVDFVITMGGTNDVWRYSDTISADFQGVSGQGDDLDGENGIEEDMFEEFVELYEKGFSEAVKYQVDRGYEAPWIIIAAIPPFGHVRTLPKNGRRVLEYINARWREQVKAWKESPDPRFPKVEFCDVHGAMIGPDGWGNMDFLVPDGVHFTVAGNKACGVAMAKTVKACLERG